MPKEPGECGGCSWTCPVNDETCRIDEDEMYDRESDDWYWTHWCITHPTEEGD